MIRREPVDFVRLIASGRWKYTHVVAYRAKFGDRVLSDALLYPFFDDCSTEHFAAYDCQQAAGKYLLELMPSCARPLRPMLRQSLPTWNLSVEQWPFYLCRQFGIEAVIKTVEDLAEAERLDPIELRAIDTLRYWIRAKPDMILGYSTR